MRVFFDVVFGCGENVADSLAPFFRVDSAVECGYVFGFAEAFGFAVFTFPGDFYAVVNHAAQNAGFAVQAQIFRYADSAGGPVERVCWARFYAEFTLHADTCMLVYGDGSFWVAVFVFAFGGFEEFLALGFGGFFWFLLGSVGKHVEDVYG